MADAIQTEINDSSHDVTEKKEVNIIRERTFTPELRDLVSRITRNEDQEDEGEVIIPSPQVETKEDMGPNELLKALHRLFYEVKNMNELNDIHPYFHYGPVINKGGRLETGKQIFDALSSSIPEFSGYAVLQLDMKMNAYVPVFSMMENGALNDLIIGFHDLLFPSLSNGFHVVTSKSFEGEMSHGGFSQYFDSYAEGSIGFLDLESIIPSLHDSSNSGREEKLTTKVEPLILCVCSAGDSLTAEEVTGSLKRNCSIPLMLMVAEIKKDSPRGKIDRDSLEYVLTELDMLRQISKKMKNSITVVIKVKPGQQFIAALSFMASKMKRLIDADIDIYNLWLGTMVCFLPGGKLPVMEILIKEMNNVFENAFSLKSYDSESANGLVDILGDILT